MYSSEGWCDGSKLKCIGRKIPFAYILEKAAHELYIAPIHALYDT